ncbi:MAG: ThiF family adenylyltransferase [Gammaproteobacteria bacterium]|nr:ThiF family adenylyltransferase [Gammaproteobacteria bacterium]MYK43505.1 ThiF family adenylyltransferase [Gammaproteobacteria bacterium]
MATRCGYTNHPYRVYPKRNTERSPKVNRTMLVMTERQHKQIFAHLFPGDGLEAAAILLCNRGSGRDTCRLIIAEIISIPHDISRRMKKYLSWPFADFFPPEIITQIDQTGQSIVTIHSHPNNFNEFSLRDNKTDKELFDSINNWFDDQRSNGSAIMLPDGRVRARVVHSEGEFSEIDSVNVVGDSIRMWKKVRMLRNSDFSNKLSQTFGRGTLELLHNIRVGVVGCSGTGSVVAELLARNCVGEIVIVDPDVLEEKNLNRIIGATMKEARDQQPKVEVAKRAIEAMDLGTKVFTYQGDTSHSEVVKALVDCDVLFGCVDSAFGRYDLDCIASAYLIPYFDVGVYLEADGRGGISNADAVSHYVHPEGKSLLEQGVYKMNQVTAENWHRTMPEYYLEQRKNGYLMAVGEEQPAVMSLNMLASCMAFNDFLARLHQFRFDKNREFSTQRYRLVHGCYEREEDGNGTNPLISKYVGTGDQSLLVRNNTVR